MTKFAKNSPKRALPSAPFFAAMPVTSAQVKSYNKTVERLREYEGDEARLNAGEAFSPHQLPRNTVLML